MRYQFIIAPRADQLNTSRVEPPDPEFDSHTLSLQETPAAVLGFRNSVPLAMTCADDA